MVDDVLIDKGAEIERAVRRAREIHGSDGSGPEHQTRQDAIVLNVVRACESGIDAAMHLVRIHRLGVPYETREAFDILERAGLIDRSLADPMRRMIEFRYQALHQGGSIDRQAMEQAIEGLDRVLDFASFVLRLAAGTGDVKNG